MNLVQEALEIRMAIQRKAKKEYIRADNTEFMEQNHKHLIFHCTKTVLFYTTLFVCNSAFNFILLLRLKSHYKCSNKNPFLIKNFPSPSHCRHFLSNLFFLLEQKNLASPFEPVGILFDPGGQTCN